MVAGRIVGSAFLACIFAFFFAVPSYELIITQFPHYQTFDSWNECYELVTCYEQACVLEAGWVNEDFAGMETLHTGFDIRNWWVKSGRTTSNTFRDNGTTLACDVLTTGPCGDATSGHGNYIYAEASGCFGSRFRARSPYFVFTQSPASLSFSYYMFGQGIDPNVTQYGLQPDGSYMPSAVLAWFISYDNGTTYNLLKEYYGQEAPVFPNGPWFRDTVTIHFTVPLPVLVVFRLEAIAPGNFYGYGSQRVWQGDIAVDDVLITQFNASNITTPYIQPTINSTTPTPVPINHNTGNLGGGGGGLSNGAIAGIVVGVVGGLCCLCLLLLLLILLVLLIVSPRKPSGGGGGGGGL